MATERAYRMRSIITSALPLDEFQSRRIVLTELHGRGFFLGTSPYRSLDKGLTHTTTDTHVSECMV